MPTSLTTIRRHTTAFLGLLLLSLASCERANESPAPPPARTGTSRMADTLRAIALAVRARPNDNIFLNTERATQIRGSLFGLSAGAALNARHRLADELLRAGQTREAIAELDRVVREAGDAATEITAQNKSFFELLALAYLRLGEQENCQTNPAANVCILPLAGGARHTRQQGAREAIRRFTELLDRFPNEPGSRWLLNIAYLQIGAYPDSVPQRYFVPGLTPNARSSFPLFSNVAANAGVAAFGLAGALSVEDLNNDGHLDLFTTAWGFGDPVHVYLADGRGGYVDSAPNSGLPGITGGLNTVHADYDNDGDVDIFVLRGAWMGESGRFPNSLLRNRGDGTFDDVTYDAGVLSFHPTQTAAWADFNRDGFLDLFVGNESWTNLYGGPPHYSELFLNNRDGTFTEVARKVGIDLNEFVKGVVWGDVNNDGLPDLFASVLYGRNRLYMNRGGSSITDWRFEERTTEAGVERPLASFPTWFWDIDNDGWEDLLVLSYDVNSAMHEMVAREFLRLPLRSVQNGKTLEAEPSKVYRNNGDGTFSDVTKRMGLDGKVIYAMGSNFGDLDNDGWLDFYAGTGNPDLRSVIPNRMFRSVSGRRFEEVTLPGGFGHLQKGHATAFADLDRDGDEDVYMVIGGAYQGDVSSSVLFENPGWAGRSWVNLRLEGRTANRSAIGARVEVVAVSASGSTRSIHRTVNTGGSFGAGSLELHVGLGDARQIQEVRIVWPDSLRTVTTHRNIAVNRFYRIVQGDGAVELPLRSVPFRKTPALTAPMSHPDMPR